MSSNLFLRLNLLNLKNVIDPINRSISEHGFPSVECLFHMNRTIKYLTKRIYCTIKHSVDASNTHDPTTTSIIILIISISPISLRTLRRLPSRCIILLIYLRPIKFGNLTSTLRKSRGKFLWGNTSSLVVASSGLLSSLTLRNLGNLKLIPFPGLTTPTAA